MAQSNKEENGVKNPFPFPLKKVTEPVAHACNSAYLEAENRRIAVQSQCWQVVFKTLSPKSSQPQKRTDEVAQGVGLEFKPQY
jgi:hypothetical protein